MLTSSETLPLIGVDTGGTFTDLVMLDGDQVTTWKLPSTPDDPAQAVLQGIQRLLDDRPARVFHGSTVATNALLEGKGSEVVFVVTAGFRDLLEIGRQDRPALYALHPVKRVPLVARSKTLEVAERTLADGSIEIALTDEELHRVVADVQATGCNSVAVCLLHSYINSSHEDLLATALEQAGIRVSASHRILAEFREYERAATTVVNATVSPVMNQYLGRLEREFHNRPLRIMQSNGGAVSATVAGQEAVRTILSGPAGGLVGALSAGSKAGFRQLITFDMGGTSTDVALCEGGLRTTTETVLAGWPIKVPMIDIHTVGAGGGSVARIDAGGALRVGPESAGALPGPVCYGRGGIEVTVTDANLYLGRLLPDRFLGGRMELKEGASRSALERLAGQVGVQATRLAEGILEVIEETMAGALRVVSVQRGHDPREFTLLPFGGAGGLHACALAEKLGMSRILLPAHPGLLSAAGMVLADVVRDYARSVLWSGQVVSRRVVAMFGKLEKTAVDDMREEGVCAIDLRMERSVDMRYRGQSFEVNVPFTPEFMALFHQRHEELYGYQDPVRDVEIVTLRLRAIGPGPSVSLLPERVKNVCRHHLETSVIMLGGEAIECPVYERDKLDHGTKFAGPALVVEETATHLVREGWHVEADVLGNLLLELHA